MWTTIKPYWFHGYKKISKLQLGSTLNYINFFLVFYWFRMWPLTADIYFCLDYFYCWFGCGERESPFVINSDWPRNLLASKYLLHFKWPSCNNGDILLADFVELCLKSNSWSFDISFFWWKFVKIVRYFGIFAVLRNFYCKVLT